MGRRAVRAGTAITLTAQSQVAQRLVAAAARARGLALAQPALQAPLEFCAALAGAQERTFTRFADAVVRPGRTFSERLAVPPAVDALCALVTALSDGPSPIARRLPAIGADDRQSWSERLAARWATGDAAEEDPLTQFVLEATLQPFAALAAPDTRAASREASYPLRCPCCNGLPLLGVLREQGHGARLSLLCGFCEVEWASQRLRCTHCGEHRAEALPLLRADEYEAVHIAACDTCRMCLKVVDLSRDGRAVPAVDDIASFPLDIRARHEGYQRGRRNRIWL